MRVARRADHEVRLVGLLRVDPHGAAVVGSTTAGRGAGRFRSVGRPGAPRGARDVVADAPAETDHHALRAVPPVEVAGERLARRGADRLLGADDVPAERLVAVDVALPDVADVVARRVGVHVHLLDDHALLALDLVGVEARVAEHVHEDVERDVARLGRALDVVRGHLLAGEGVELAPDRVDLRRDVARGGPPPVPLKKRCSAKWAMPLSSRRS